MRRISSPNCEEGSGCINNNWQQIESNNLEDIVRFKKSKRISWLERVERLTNVASGDRNRDSHLSQEKGREDGQEKES